MARQNSADGFMNLVVFSRKDAKKFAKGEKVESFSIAGKALYEDKPETTNATILPKKVAKKLYNTALELLPKARTAERGVVVMPFAKFGSLKAMLDAYDLEVGIEVRDANYQPEVEVDDSDIEL